MIAVVASSCFAEDIGRVHVNVAQDTRAETLRSEWANLKCVLNTSWVHSHLTLEAVHLWEDLSGWMLLLLQTGQRFSYNAYTNGKPCCEMDRQVNSCSNTRNAKYKLKRFKKKRRRTYSSIETLWKLSELCQCVSKQHVRVGAVEQNADYCLGGTGIVNDLKTQNNNWFDKKKQTLLLLHMLAHWKWNDKILKLQQITILGTMNPLPLHVKLNKVFKTGEQHANTKNIAKDLCRMCRKE